MRRKPVCALVLVAATAAVAGSGLAGARSLAPGPGEYRGTVTQTLHDEGVEPTDPPTSFVIDMRSKATLDVFFDDQGDLGTFHASDLSHSGSGEWTSDDPCNARTVTFSLLSGGQLHLDQNADDGVFIFQYPEHWHQVDCTGSSDSNDLDPPYQEYDCPTANVPGDPQIVFDSAEETDDGEVTCSGTLTKVGTAPPIASITYRGSGTTNEFNFDGSGSVAPGGSITKYEWNFGDGTATGATVVHQFSGPGEHTVKLTVTDTNGFTDTATTTLVPKLTIDHVAIEPDPADAGDPFTLHVQIRNDGGVPIAGVAPTVSVSPDTVAMLDSGPKPASADLDAGTEQTFDYTLNGVGEGQATAEVDASGTGPGGTVNASHRTRKFDVGSTSLALDLTLDPTSIGVGGTTNAKLHVTNNSGHAITGLTPTLTADPSAGVTIGDPTGGDSTIADGADTTFTITVTAANEGTLTVKGKATATVESTGDAVSSPEKTAQFEVGTSLVVTTTGDEKLPDWARDARICDVDPIQDDNQCTLRAAIDLVNAWTELDKITVGFDIPGSDVPRIAPLSALPDAKRPVVIDGATQPAGSVRIGATDKHPRLAVSGGHSTFHGLDGPDIALSGPGSDRVEGNVDVSVDAEADDETIGGSNPGPGCADPCNRLRFVRIGHGTFTHHVKVQGNWINLSADGKSLLDEKTDGVDAGPANEETLLGGDTGKPGTGLGNVIEGVHGIVMGGSHNQIAGNIIGLTADGLSIPAQNGRAVKLHGGIQITGPGVYLIGGTPGEGNVISGFDTSQLDEASIGAPGIAVDPPGLNANLTIRHNLIGTDITGLRVPGDGSARAGSPYSNGTGVLISSGSGSVTRIEENVISGNTTGIALGGAVDDARVEIAGNLIGTTRLGFGQLPNRAGIWFLRAAAGHIGGDRGTDAGCVSPCNVISGNREAGIRGGYFLLEGGGDFPPIQGNYIGADINGGALPNGAGPQPANAFTGGIAILGHSGKSDEPEKLLIGGPSDVVHTGACIATCNLIVGNGVAGINLALDLDARVEGNLITSTAGPGVLTGGAGSDSPFLVTGNLIRHNAAAGVETEDGRVDLRGNSMYGNQSGFRTPPATTPVIDRATVAAGRLRITAHFVSAGFGRRYRVDVYGETECPRVGAAQGRTPIGSVVLSGITGSTFTIVLPAPSAANHFVDATLTDVTGPVGTPVDIGKTGPFSACVPLRP
jgi:hypothetical protein